MFKTYQSPRINDSSKFPIPYLRLNKEVGELKNSRGFINDSTAYNLSDPNSMTD